jgi:hypothetical protein
MASEQLLYLCNEYLELASLVRGMPGVKSVGNVAR